MKSYRKFDMKRRRKAPHSTLKRIILTHCQMVSLVFSLTVPWPKLMLDMWSIITAVSTVSENTNGLECLITSERDHAGFFYGVLLIFAIMPFVFILCLAIYWLVLVRHCNSGRVLSCGTKLKLGPLQEPVKKFSEEVLSKWKIQFALTFHRSCHSEDRL